MRTVGLVLAGGAGRRMGGQDKALIELGGQTLMARALARLGPQVDGMAISAGGDRARFAAWDLPVLDDGAHAGKGPLAGICAGLAWAAAQGAGVLATVAVDTPFFPTDLVARLRACGHDFAVARHGGRLHPAFGLWPARVADRLQAALAGDTRRLGDWALAEGAAAVDFPDGGVPFFNINTAADLAMARTLAG